MEFPTAVKSLAYVCHPERSAYELLIVDDAIREALMAHRTAGEIREVGMGCGMRSLLQDGLRQVLAGVTSPDEVLRVCQG